MKPKCPNCKKEISYIREFQKTEVCYNVRLDKKGDVDYEKDDGFDGCADDWGCAECPECAEEIPGIADETEARLFLKGDLVWCEGMTQEEVDILYADRRHVWYDLPYKRWLLVDWENTIKKEV